MRVLIDWYEVSAAEVLPSDPRWDPAAPRDEGQVLVETAGTDIDRVWCLVEEAANAGDEECDIGRLLDEGMARLEALAPGEFRRVPLGVDGGRP